MPSCWALPNFVPHQEMSLLHRFRRRAYPYVGRAVTAGEAIFLARRAGSVRGETAVSTVRMRREAGSALVHSIGAFEHALLAACANSVAQGDQRRDPGRQTAGIRRMSANADAGLERGFGKAVAERVRRPMASDRRRDHNERWLREGDRCAVSASDSRSAARKIPVFLPGAAAMSPTSICLARAMRSFSSRRTRMPASGRSLSRRRACPASTLC